MHITSYRRIGLSFLLTLAVWMLFSWPLPRYLFSGIPSSARTIEKIHARKMIAGDHLQLLYHFWLPLDMAAGKTPLFHNLYEFNTGDDNDRYAPGTYFVPSSAFFALGSLIGGRAFGWNFALFMSVWMTCLFTWLLARRYTANEYHAVIAGLVSILLPYPWIMLFGGSPTGFALLWVPLLFLGLDMAVRDEKISGGMWASLALIFACGSDTHVFFFCALMTPAWIVLALIAREDFQWNRPLPYLKLMLSLSPLLLAALVAYGYQYSVKQHLAGSHMAAGRNLGEVSAFSPRPEGLFFWKHLGMSNQVYIGFTVPVLLLAGWLCALREQAKKPITIVFRSANGRLAVVITALSLGLLGIMILALGPNGPFEGISFRIARKVVPHYDKIRQAGKIFCLIPACMGLATAISLTLLSRMATRKKWNHGWLVLGGLLCLIEYRFQITPMVCVLDREQPAYEAVFNEAVQNKQLPRALALPLWPGDSHWSSLYQYYGSLYRIRMINGYSPIVKDAYFKDVFLRFESANIGELTDNQLDNLHQRGIHHIVFHENAYPEKVSAFPVGFTLKKFLNHPRLKLLRQAEHVWAFSILPVPEKRPALAEHWKTLFPAKRWEAEQCARENCEIAPDPTAGNGAVVSMREKTATLWIKRPVGIGKTPNLSWMVRTRGRGTLLADVKHDRSSQESSLVMIGSDKWTWISVPISEPESFSTVTLKLDLTDGTVDVDMILLTDGAWFDPRPGESISFPAPTFFHAGYTDLKTDSVVFRKDSEPYGTVLYGPFLPLPVGKYEAQLIFNSTTSTYASLGSIQVISGSEQSDINAFAAGEPARCMFTQKENLPVNLIFNYSRQADLKVSEVVFLRLE